MVEDGGVEAGWRLGGGWVAAGWRLGGGGWRLGGGSGRTGVAVTPIGDELETR